MATTKEFDWQFIRGQQAYQKGKPIEELPTPISRAGWECEKYQHEKKTRKSENN